MKGTHCPYRIEGVFRGLVQKICLRSPRGREWLALALAIMVLFALGIALSSLVFWLLTRERDADESEKEYWRMHGG
jgi:hypothetical protein